MGPETDGSGRVALDWLFKAVLGGTFAFNLIVIMPLLVIVGVVGGPEVASQVRPGFLASQPGWAVVPFAFLIAPIAGAVAGLQNAIIVCVGLWLYRRLSVLRRSSPAPS